MNTLNIPLNIRVKINGRQQENLYPFGEFALTSKNTPTSIMLLYASFRLLIESFKQVIK